MLRSPNGTTRTRVHLVEKSFAKSRSSCFTAFCNTGEDGILVVTGVAAGGRRRNRLPETTTATVARQWGQDADLPNKIFRGFEGTRRRRPNDNRKSAWQFLDVKIACMNGVESVILEKEERRRRFRTCA